MNIYEASEHIGAAVTYRPTPGMVERGVIESVNTRFVFVRYGGEALAKATGPELLELSR